MANFHMSCSENVPLAAENRYRQRVPPNLTLPGGSLHHPPADYWSPGHDAAAVLAKMNYRVSDEGFYIPSPAVYTPQLQQRQVFTFEFAATPTNAYPVPPNCNRSSYQPTPSMYQPTPSPHYPSTPLWNPATTTIYHEAPATQDNQTESSYPTATHSYQSIGTNGSWHQPQTFQHQNRQPLGPMVNQQKGDLSSYSMRRLLLEKNNMAAQKVEQTFQSCLYASQQTCSPTMQLQIPSIRPSPSVAMNIMEEESDLGYCSFSDASSSTSPVSEHPVIHGTPNDVTIETFDSGSNGQGLTQLLSDVIHCVGELHDLKDISPDMIEDIPQKGCFDMYIKAENIDNRSCHYVNHSESADTTIVANHSTSAASGDKKVHKCSQCDKLFASNTNLVVHMRQHSGERPHKCSKCGKSFAQRSTLRTHIRVHTGERPYGCKDCGRAFADYSTFAKHRRTHTGEKPYSCDICGKAFAQSGNMIRHKLTHRN